MRWLLTFLLMCSAVYANTLLPRRVIGFWDSHNDRNEDEGSVRAFEMPLNYLGIDLEQTLTMQEVYFCEKRSIT